MSNEIRLISAMEILDSRGNPTVQATVITDKGAFTANTPSGASVGKYEALELRDGGQRYLGKGVQQAVRNINDIIYPKLKGIDCTCQREIDEVMLRLDGTDNKGHLGANALTAVSMAIAKGGAASYGIPLYCYIGQLAGHDAVTLPIPQMNVINSGAHVGIENDCQEHLIMPIVASSFQEALRMSAETYSMLRILIRHEYGVGGTHLGDEGGFVPPIRSVEERLKLICKAIEESGYKGQIGIGLDAAASEFYKDGKYTFLNQELSANDLIDLYEEWIKQYGVISLEDGLSEDDWNGWEILFKRLGNKIQIVGDDLFTTNIERIQKGIQLNICNSIIIKINQIGTVSEAMEASRISSSAGWSIVVAHRSGETADTFISDFAVGLDASQCKFGAPARSDRTAKYNQLLRIEGELGEKGRYAGINFPYKP